MVSTRSRSYKQPAAPRKAKQRAAVSGQQLAPTTPARDNSVIEAIIGHNLAEDGSRQYLVKWQGLESDQATWERADQLGSPLKQAWHEAEDELTIIATPTATRDDGTKRVIIADEDVTVRKNEKAEAQDEYHPMDVDTRRKNPELIEVDQETQQAGKSENGHAWAYDVRALGVFYIDDLAAAYQEPSQYMSQPLGEKVTFDVLAEFLEQPISQVGEEARFQQSAQAIKDAQSLGLKSADIEQPHAEHDLRQAEQHSDDEQMSISTPSDYLTRSPVVPEAQSKTQHPQSPLPSVQCQDVNHSSSDPAQPISSLAVAFDMNSAVKAGRLPFYPMCDECTVQYYSHTKCGCFRSARCRVCLDRELEKHGQSRLFCEASGHDTGRCDVCRRRVAPGYPVMRCNRCLGLYIILHE